MSANQEPRAPFSFRETEPYVGEGPFLRDRRRRLLTIGLLVLVASLALLAVLVPRMLWTQSLDPSANARTGLPDGSYVITPTSSLHDGDDCWFRGPVRGLPDAGDVTVVGQGAVQCAGPTERVAEVEVVVRNGPASIARADNY